MEHFIYPEDKYSRMEDPNKIVLSFSYQEGNTGLEGDTGVQLEVGDEWINLTEDQLRIISYMYQGSVEARRYRYMFKSIERGEHIEEMGQ